MANGMTVWVSASVVVGQLLLAATTYAQPWQQPQPVQQQWSYSSPWYPEQMDPFGFIGPGRTSAYPFARSTEPTGPEQVENLRAALGQPSEGSVVSCYVPGDPSWMEYRLITLGQCRRLKGETDREVAERLQKRLNSKIVSP